MQLNSKIIFYDYFNARTKMKAKATHSENDFDFRVR